MSDLSAQTTSPGPCLVCGKSLAPAFEDSRQPLGAITFRGGGSWGSDFDEMRGELHVNVCDPCLRDRADRILHVHTKTTETQDFRPWNPEEDR